MYYLDLQLENLFGFVKESENEQFFPKTTAVSFELKGVLFLNP